MKGSKFIFLFIEMVFIIEDSKRKCFKLFTGFIKYLAMEKFDTVRFSQTRAQMQNNFNACFAEFLNMSTF